MKSLIILDDPPYGTERCAKAGQKAAATLAADKVLVF